MSWACTCSLNCTKCSLQLGLTAALAPGSWEGQSSAGGECLAQVPVRATSPRTVTMGLLELLTHMGTQLMMQGFLAEQVGC